MVTFLTLVAGMVIGALVVGFLIKLAIAAAVGRGLGW